MSGCVTFKPAPDDRATEEAAEADGEPPPSTAAEAPPSTGSGPAALRPIAAAAAAAALRALSMPLLWLLRLALALAAAPLALLFGGWYRHNRRSKARARAALAGPPGRRELEAMLGAVPSWLAGMGAATEQLEWLNRLLADVRGGRGRGGLGGLAAACICGIGHPASGGRLRDHRPSHGARSSLPPSTVQSERSAACLDHVTHKPSLAPTKPYSSPPGLARARPRGQRGHPRRGGAPAGRLKAPVHIQNGCGPRGRWSKP